VTLYLACGNASAAQACASGQSEATFTMSGQKTYSLAAPTSDTFKGLTIFADRNNTSALSLSANSGDSFTGGIYALSGSLNLSANASTSMSARIVVGTASVSGNATITLNSPPSSALTADTLSNVIASTADVPSDTVAMTADASSDTVAMTSDTSSDVAAIDAATDGPSAFTYLDGGAAQ